MKTTKKLYAVLGAAVLAWGIVSGAVLAQVEQAHLRIDGMT